MKKTWIVANQSGTKGRARHWLPFLMGMQAMLCIVFILGVLRLTHAADFQFIVMADSRGKTTGDPINTGSFTATLASAKNKAPNADFMLFGGDFVWGHANGTDTKNQLGSWKAIVNDHFPNLVTDKKIYPAFGSHERNFLDSHYH